MSLTLPYDLSGNDLIVNSLSTGSATPGGVGTQITATAAQLNAVANDGSRFVAAGSTKTLSSANNKQVIALDTATGSVVTLPAASGSGLQFTFYVKTLATSNSHIVYTASANGVGGSDVFEGIIPGTRVDSGNAVLGFAAQSTSNTITLNRSTTGSVTKGETFTVQDVATNVWLVKDAFLSSTGAAFATPFSHT